MYFIQNSIARFVVVDDLTGANIPILFLSNSPDPGVSN